MRSLRLAAGGLAASAFLLVSVSVASSAPAEASQGLGTPAPAAAVRFAQGDPAEERRDKKTYERLYEKCKRQGKVVGVTAGYEVGGSRIGKTVRDGGLGLKPTSRDSEGRLTFQWYLRRGYKLCGLKVLYEPNASGTTVKDATIFPKPDQLNTKGGTWHDPGSKLLYSGSDPSAVEGSGKWALLGEITVLAVKVR